MDTNDPLAKALADYEKAYVALLQATKDLVLALKPFKNKWFRAGQKAVGYYRKPREGTYHVKIVDWSEKLPPITDEWCDC